MTAAEYERVRNMYDEAFRRWSSAVRSGERGASVESLYRERRDALARAILQSNSGPRSAAVERLAYSLWERAGRPLGTAESDWYRAEAFFSSLCMSMRGGNALSA